VRCRSRPPPAWARFLAQPPSQPTPACAQSATASRSAGRLRVRWRPALPAAVAFPRLSSSWSSSGFPWADRPRHPGRRYVRATGPRSADVFDTFGSGVGVTPGWVRRRPARAPPRSRSIGVLGVGLARRHRAGPDADRARRASPSARSVPTDSPVHANRVPRAPRLGRRSRLRHQPRLPATRWRRGRLGPLILFGLPPVPPAARGPARGAQRHPTRGGVLRLAGGSRHCSASGIRPVSGLFRPRGSARWVVGDSASRARAGRAMVRRVRSGGLSPAARRA